MISLTCNIATARRGDFFIADANLREAHPDNPMKAMYQGIGKTRQLATANVLFEAREDGVTLISTDSFVE